MYSPKYFHFQLNVNNEASVPQRNEARRNERGYVGSNPTGGSYFKFQQNALIRAAGSQGKEKRKTHANEVAAENNLNISFSKLDPNPPTIIPSTKYFILKLNIKIQVCGSSSKETRRNER
ncbi:hypothetical protein ACOME3_002093 [Neoechinorhynchus agilis]